MSIIYWALFYFASCSACYCVGLASGAHQGYEDGFDDGEDHAYVKMGVRHPDDDEDAEEDIAS